MINWLLWHLFRRATVDLDLVARALASRIIDTNVTDLVTLDESGTLQHLRTRYTQIAVECGLPTGAASHVADRAWRFVADAQMRVDDGDNVGFSFYT